MSTERLYGLQGAEELHFDIATVWEADIEPHIEDDTGGSRIIEEWTVHPPEYHFPKAEHIVESVIEWACDNGEVAEGWPDGLPSISDPELNRAAEALRQAIASKVTYRMANQKVAEHTLTWSPGEESEPSLDGEPMYRQRV